VDGRIPVGTWLEEAAAAFERHGNRRGRERALALMVEWLRRSGGRGAVGDRDRTLIESVSRLLNSLPDLRELTQRAMELAVEQFGAERGVLLLADPESEALTPMLNAPMYRPIAPPRRAAGNVSTTRRIPGIYVPARPMPPSVRSRSAEVKSCAIAAKSSPNTPVHRAETR